MAGILNAIAARINADVAGLTGGPTPTTNRTTGATFSEMLGSDLDFLTGGHFHAPSLQPLERVEGSVAGDLGGRVPVATAHQAPGPTGPANAARSLLARWRG